MSLPHTLIVGIGSPHGDDQFGWLVAERLAADVARDDVLVRKAASPIELLDWLADIDRLVICDACRGLGPLGELRRWTWPNQQLKDSSTSGTHEVSLVAVLQLAQQLGRLPRHVFIRTVEGAAAAPLGTISPEVAAALPRMVSEITKEVTSSAHQ